MKSFQSYLDEATEDQVRAQNPNASPEMVRRAAEKSQRGAAQREGKQKRTQNDISKGQRALPPSGGALAKVEPKSSSLVNTPKVQSKQTQRVNSGSGGDGLATNRGRYSSKPRTAAERITSDKVSSKKSSGGSSSASERLASAQLKDREDASKKAKFDKAKEGLGKTYNATKKLATLPGSGNKVGTSGSEDLKGPSITK